MYGSFRRALTIVAVTAAIAAPVVAQQPSSDDIQRLQATVDDVADDITVLRRTDSAAARSLQTELDDIQDDVAAFRVDLRRNRTITQSDYDDVRDKLERLRERARGNEGRGPFAATSTDPADDRDRDRERGGSRREDSRRDDDRGEHGVVPVGTEIDVRLQTALNSNTAHVEDRFEATTVVDLRQHGEVLIPAGSVMRGIVNDVKDAGRVDRKGSLSLTFEQLRVAGRNYPMRGSVSEALESGGYREDAGKIGAGAAIGGIIGGILGGAKGAITGVLIGGGGVVAATEGQDVQLQPGTVLRVRLDQPLNMK